MTMHDHKNWRTCDCRERGCGSYRLAPGITARTFGSATDADEHRLRVGAREFIDEIVALNDEHKMGTVESAREAAVERAYQWALKLQNRVVRPASTNPPGTLDIERAI